MRTSAPALLPIFRSQAQAELLACLYLHPGREFSLTELARRVGVSVPTVHREAERLVESRLVTETTLGRNRLLGANPNHPAAESLGRLLEVTFGPRQVVAEEFAEVPGADQVLIFGSWAARYAGETGHAPNDIDVMVIGDSIDRADLYAAGDRAQQRLDIPVNPVMRTHRQWDDPSDRLSVQVRSMPVVDVMAVGRGV
jgi:DNA-binding Lrp family transcriptional regulator